MKSLFKRILAMLCVCMLVISEVPASAAEDISKLAGGAAQQTDMTAKKDEAATTEKEDGGSISVATQKQLKSALASEAVTAGKEVTIRIETAKAVTFTIPEGDYANVVFCVEGAKIKLKNNASVQRMVIYDAKSYTEYAKDNVVKIYDKKLTVNVAKGARVSEMTISKAKSKITLKNSGSITKLEAMTAVDLKITQSSKLERLILNRTSTVELTGSVKNVTEITIGANAGGTELTTAVPAKVALYADADITFAYGSSRSTSQVNVMSDSIGYSVHNSTKKVISIFDAEGRESFAKKNKTVSHEAPIEIEKNETPEGAPAEPVDETVKDTSEAKKEQQTEEPVWRWEDEPYTPSYDPVYTTYYEVTFAAGSEVSAEGISLPEKKIYQSGSRIGVLPAAYMQDHAFLGWFYDAACTQTVSENDAVYKDMTLYAKLTEVAALPETETPNFVSVTIPADEVSAYRFGIRHFSAEDVTFTDITGGNEEVLFSVGADGTVDAPIAQGRTYTVVLADNAQDVFVIDGIEQPESVRVFNIITEKDEVRNLSLAADMIYIPAGDVTDMSGELLDGLFVAGLSEDTDGSISENRYTGAFTYYAGTLTVGDTVAIYNGTRPDLREKDSDNGSVAYVVITAKNGNRYTYESADAENILFVPDILPVSVSADMDGDAYNNSITVDLSVMDFSDDAYEELGLGVSTTVDEGDFLVLYAGSLTDPSSYSYVRVTGVTKGTSTYKVDYVLSSEEEMASAMDMYSSRAEEIELTAEEIAQIESDMEQQALASGFADEAATYLTALALETDGFSELSDDLDMDLESYRIYLNDGREVQPGELSLMAGGTAKITKIVPKASVKTGRNLKHFSNRSGIRAELSLSFTVVVADKVEINVNAVFEQEVILSLNISGGAIKKKVWAFIYKISDYELNANIDVGTYTGIGITATAKKKTSVGELLMKGISAISSANDIYDLGSQIAGLIGKSGTLLDTADDEEGGAGLVKKYSDFMSDINSTWFDVVRVNLFSTKGTVDPLHILCYGIGVDFVVKATVYVTLGMTFTYSNAKRYNFSVRVFSKKTTNRTVDLEEENYNFNFYVFGTIGVEAGIELDLRVGLFSLSLDSIGIWAGVGAYAQMWGYFGYQCSWRKSAGKRSKAEGAMYIEVGAYLEVGFRAEALSGKISCRPTLHDERWPILQVGDSDNIYAFSKIDEKELNIELKSAKTTSLPTEMFNMDYVELVTGTLHGTDAEDPSEDCARSMYAKRAEAYTIMSSNPKITYDLLTNRIVVDPQGSVEEEGDIRFIYKGGTLSFTSEPIERTIHVRWSDEAGARFIQMESNGGSSVEMIRRTVGATVTVPDSPVKTGYVFGGWYSDPALTSSFNFPAYMPDYDTEAGKGVTVYARWIPATNTRYTVEHYIQQNNGTYELTDTDHLTGTTDSLSAAAAKTEYLYSHYNAMSFEQQAIEPNGSTVIQIYYQPKSYTITFTYGNVSGAPGDTTPVQIIEKYGRSVFVPLMTLDGYVFVEYKDAAGRLLEFPEETRTIQVTGNATYNAAWTYADDTHYEVDRYIELPSGGAYSLAALNAVKEGKGTTNSVIDIYGPEYAAEGLTIVKATVSGRVTTAPTIAANGSTVVKLYYNRNLYSLSYDAMGGSTVAPVEVSYGAQPESSAVPVRPGYTFGGWFLDRALSEPFVPDGFEMPAEDITVYAKWIEGTDTPYLIRRFVEKISGEGYEPFAEGAAISGQGTTLSTIDTGSPLYLAEGLTLDHAEVDGSTVVSPVIAADGSTIVNLYYTRNVYRITYETNGGSSINASGCRYGAVTAVPPVPSKTGYVFAGWFSDPECMTEFVFGEYTMSIGGLKVYAKWNPATDTAYVIERYALSTDGTAYAPMDVLNLHGTTGDLIDVYSDICAAEGYTAVRAAIGEETALEPVIAPDGSTVVRVYYDRNDYVLRFDSNGGSAVEPVTDCFGSALTAPVAPTKAGYVFDGWYYDESFAMGAELESETMPAHDTYLFAKWVPAPDTVYKIERYARTLDGTGYEAWALAPEVICSGTTEAVIDIHAEEFGIGGLTLEFARVGETEVSEPKITADGQTVVKLYFIRNSYELSFNANGGSTVAAASYLFGAAPAAPEEPSRQGYSFAGWYTDTELGTPYVFADEHMPAESVELYAAWEPDTDTVYTVQHYQQNVSATGYVLAESREQRGTTATTGSAIAMTYEHFVLNTSAEETVAEGQIAADGSTVLKLYYDRELLTVTYSANGGSFAEDEGGPRVYRYGQTFEYDTPSREDYAFDGWYAGTERFTGSTVSESMELSAHWNAGGVNFTVEHYVMDVNGQYPETPTMTETKSGTVDSRVTYETLKNGSLEAAGGISYQKAEYDGTAAASGTVIKGMTVQLYYQRSKYDFNYEIRFADDPEATYISSPTEYYYGQQVQQSVTDTAGYHGVWTVAVPDTMPAHSVTSVIVEELNVYTLSYVTNGGSSVAAEEVAYKTQLSKPDAPVKTGYVFDGWYYDNETFANAVDYAGGDRMPASGTVLFAKWAPAHDTAYRIVRYGEKISGDGYDPMAENADMSCTGTTGSVIDIHDARFAEEGFTLVSAKVGAEEVSAPVIAADGSTVVKLYFDRAIYSLGFESNGGSAVSTEQIAYGHTFNRPSDPVMAGYDFAGWYYDDVTFARQVDFEASSMPAAATTLYAKWTAGTNTAYEIRMYLETADGTAYSLMQGGTVSGHGTTGSVIDYSAYTASGEGYSFSYAEVGSITVSESQPAVIAADGSTVLELYFTRNTYTVRFDTNGGSAVPECTYRYGATVSAAEEPSRQGYSFAGWYTDNETFSSRFAVGEETMPAHDITLYAEWTAAAVSYTVEFYCETQDGTGYEAYAAGPSAVLTGMTGSAISLSQYYNLCAGFEYDHMTVNGEQTEAPTVSADGLTVVRMYFDRIEYKVWYYVDGGAEPAVTQTYRYGTPITEPAYVPVKQGYVFDGWGTYGGGAFSFENAVMPAGNLALQATWRAADDTPYTIIRYGTSLTGNYELLTGHEEEHHTGTTGTTPVEVTGADIPGYTLSVIVENGEEVEQPHIGEAGDTVITLYYQRNDYTISFDTGLGSSIEPMTFKYGALLVAPTDPLRAGYDFSHWSITGTGQIFSYEDATMPAGDIGLTAEWTARSDTVYTVERYLQKGSGNGYYLMDTMSYRGVTDTAVDITPDAIEHYDCNRILFPQGSDLIIKGDGTTVLKLYYDRKILIQSVLLSGESKVAVGTISRLQAAVLPESVWDKDVLWSSSDTSIVTVDENGTIRGIRLGEATVTATIPDGSVSQTFAVNVVSIQHKCEEDRQGAELILTLNDFVQEWEFTYEQTEPLILDMNIYGFHELTIDAPNASVLWICGGSRGIHTLTLTEAIPVIYLGVDIDKLIIQCDNDIETQIISFDSYEGGRGFITQIEGSGQLKVVMNNFRVPPNKVFGVEYCHIY